MLYLAAARIFTEFDLELYDTVKARDVDTHREYFFGEPAPGSKGIRFRVMGIRA